MQTIATACRNHLRQMDVLARYGGEEFIILFTVSLGVATLSTRYEPLDNLLARADKALNQAKEAGRKAWAHPEESA